MIKNKFKYNEIEYAKYIENNGFLTRFHTYELKILVKYWKHIGIKPKQRKEKLYEFCEKYIDSFDRAVYYKLINSTLAYATKKSSVPIVIESIPLYKHEFDYFNSLPVEESAKKVVMTLYIEKKIHKRVYQITNNTMDTSEDVSMYIKRSTRLYRAIKESSKIPAKVKITDITYELGQLGLATYMRRGLMRLNFIEELNQQTSEKLIDITSFDEIGYYFDMLNGDKKIGGCCDCKRLIKKKANNQLRCKECGEEYQKNYNTLKKREYRKKCPYSETL